MTVDPAQTLRGALAGALAAGAWAAQSPLDMRVFGVHYRDQELLGKAVTRGPAWQPVGIALHLANGALFGAAYTHVAPRLPVPTWARGAVAGLVEHLATWPLAVVGDRLHPARDQLPDLSGNLRAFAQATWRHLLFGVVLGEVERWLSRRARPSLSDYPPVLSSNGHGDLEHAAGPAR